METEGLGRRVGQLVTTVAGWWSLVGAVVIALVITLWHDIVHAPWYGKAFWALAVVLAIILIGRDRRRIAQAVRHLFAKPATAHVNQRMTLVEQHAPGGVRAEGIMMVQGDPGVQFPVPRIPKLKNIDPDYLTSLSGELTGLSERILAECVTNEPPSYSHFAGTPEEQRAAWLAEDRKHDEFRQLRKNNYNAIDPLVVAAYTRVVNVGLRDVALERQLLMPESGAHPYREIARRVGALGELLRAHVAGPRIRRSHWWNRRGASSA